MENTYPSATELVQRLDPEEIRERLAAIERERKALMTLLRAATRAQREKLREVPRGE